MTTLTCEHKNCPPDDALGRLLTAPSDAGDTPPELGAVTDHVGACTGCQSRIEAIATAGDPAVSDVVRHIDKATPPKGAAYWDALAAAERADTGTYAEVPVPSQDGDGADDRGKLSLEFLQPSDTPGMLGRVGPFDIKKVIGRGGMGVVLLGFDPWLHRDVAIKVLDPQLANNDTAHARFCREARAAAGVSHDNLVGVFQVDDDEKSGLPFLVMQLVVGESLEQKLKRVERLTVPEAVRLGMQAAAGLAAAHATGLIHRDIKPGNILLEAPTDKAKLTDFGLARAAEDLKLTRTGFVAGTPLYMAPEQAQGDPIDARSDLFSLGSVLYETLAGKPPFEGRTPLAVLRRVADEAHPPLRKINPAVPVWLENLIDRLLAKDPADRPQTANEVAETLAFKLSTLQTVSPLEVPAAHSGRLSSPACEAQRRKRFCARTAGTLAAVFTAGTLVGVGSVAVMMPCLVPPVGPAGSPAAALVAAVDPPGPEAVPLKSFQVQSGAVWSVALSPDGKTMAAGVENGRINLWDATGRTGRRDELHPPKDDSAPAHVGAVWDVEFLDDTTLVSVSDDGEIKVWAAEGGSWVQKESHPVTAVRSAAVSPKERLVALGDRTGFVWVFHLTLNPKTGVNELVLKDQYYQKSAVNAVAFNPDGDMLASGGADGSVIFRDLARKKSQTGRPLNAPVYGLSFSADGAKLASATWSGDQAAQVWDVAAAQTEGKPVAQPEGAWAAPFAPCGEMFATAGQDGRTRLWDTKGTLMADLGMHKGPVHTARFTADGTLITGGRDGVVRVWDAHGCKVAVKGK